MRIDRRRVLSGIGLATPALFGLRAERAYAAAVKPEADAEKARELAADVVIIGGGVGGCAAALAACRSGFRVIMTEETDWIGGQLTAQAVPPDENRFIEQFGCTRAYRDFRNRIRDYYRRNYPLTAEARAEYSLSPGRCGVSRICHEPRAALTVLGEMLAPCVSTRRLTVLLEHRATTAAVDQDQVRAVRVRDLRSGAERVLTAPYFIDATEAGDLLPLTGTEYVTGAEAQSQTDEPHARADAQPLNMQGFTVCFAMDYLPGEDHTIDRPREYDFWRDYVPALTPPWPGKLLSFTYSRPTNLQPRTLPFDPLGEGIAGPSGWWTYRRIASWSNFLPGNYAGDISLVNWPQNDYLEGVLFEVSEAEAKRHLERGKQLSLSLLYWLQTEAPRADGGTGWPGLRLRSDVVGTEDGLAKLPYLREARRIKAVTTVVEQDVGTEARMHLTGKPREEVRARAYEDSVGIGSYRIDLHRWRCAGRAGQLRLR